MITQSSGKQRIIDNADAGGQTLRSSDANKLVLCSPLRPAQHISQVLRHMSSHELGQACATDTWESGGEDWPDAYRHSPIRVTETRGCVVAFWHHEWSAPAFQVYAGLLFGLPLAVTSFNRYSRLVEALGRHLCYALVSLYFDDASIQDWSSSRGPAQWAFGTLNQLLGTPFVPQSIQYMKSTSIVGRKPVLHLILQRQTGRSHRYQFQLHLQEIEKMKRNGKLQDHCLILHEMERTMPSLVLLCAEEQNWFTFLQTAMSKQHMNVVTITEDDDATSAYGKSKVKACIRSELDCVFFAGPCTGGSAWNRLNRTISNKAAKQIKQHQQLCWQLWEHFADALEHVFSVDACALTELPRSCEFWNDKRMVQLVNGTESHVHVFDGCMYGLTSQYNAKGLAIKAAVEDSFVGGTP